MTPRDGWDDCLKLETRIHNRNIYLQFGDYWTWTNMVMQPPTMVDLMECKTNIDILSGNLRPFAIENYPWKYMSLLKKWSYSSTFYSELLISRRTFWRHFFVATTLDKCWCIAWIRNVKTCPTNQREIQDLKMEALYHIIKAIFWGYVLT